MRSSPSPCRRLRSIATGRARGSTHQNLCGQQRTCGSKAQAKAALRVNICTGRGKAPLVRPTPVADRDRARGFRCRPDGELVGSSRGESLQEGRAMTSASMRNRASAADAPPFRAPYAPADEELAARFLAEAARGEEAEARIDARAAGLIEAIRARAGGVGGIEDFLHEYSLSTKEGLALMVLAEALLRVPDNATADRLIEDKLTAADFSRHEVRSDALLVSASAWALGLSARIVQAHETPETILASLVGRLGPPAVRTATRQAMRLLGSHFVLGQTIAEALGRARAEFRYSFDMLGEGARAARDA